MSRSGYVDNGDEWALIRWRGAVASAIRGERGQAFLIGLAKLMDEMPVKRLIAHDLVKDGEACTLGVACMALNIDTSQIIFEDPEFGYDEEATLELSKKLGIAAAMIREIEYENDEGVWGDESPEQRWSRMRNWIEKKIIK